MQNQEAQVAKMDALGCRTGEIRELLAQRELRMETQMRDMYAQIQTMNDTRHQTKPTAGHAGGMNSMISL